MGIDQVEPGEVYRVLSRFRTRTNKLVIGGPHRREHRPRRREIVPVCVAPARTRREVEGRACTILFWIDANGHDAEAPCKRTEIATGLGKGRANKGALRPAVGADKGERDDSAAETLWGDENAPLIPQGKRRRGWRWRKDDISV